MYHGFWEANQSPQVHFTSPKKITPCLSRTTAWWDCPQLMKIISWNWGVRTGRIGQFVFVSDSLGGPRVLSVAKGNNKQVVMVHGASVSLDGALHNVLDGVEVSECWIGALWLVCAEPSKRCNPLLASGPFQPRQNYVVWLWMYSSWFEQSKAQGDLLRTGRSQHICGKYGVMLYGVEKKSKKPKVIQVDL